MEGARTRLLRIEVTRDPDVVLIRFRDTGPGVANPAALFRPFQPAAGSCFAVQLLPVADDGKAGIA